MRRILAAIMILAAMIVTTPAAHADPVDDLRQQVADYYNKKFGCEAYHPLICPGPVI